MQQFLHKDMFFTEVHSTINHIGVLFFPSAFGIAPDVISQLRHISQHAGHVIAFDPFFKDDPGFADYQDMPRIMDRIQKLDRNQLLSHAIEAIKYLREKGSTKIIMIGVCFGGPFVLQLASQKLIDCGIIWHGSRLENFLDLAKEITCPLDFHFGEIDPITPLTTIDAIKKSFSQHNNKKFHIHHLANHGFSHSLSPAFNGFAERAAMLSVEEHCHKLERS